MYFVTDRKTLQKKKRRASRSTNQSIRALIDILSEKGQTEIDLALREISDPSIRRYVAAEVAAKRVQVNNQVPW